MVPHQILLSPDDLPVDHPVKSLGRRNSNDVCTPCRDFITTAGGAKCYQVIISCVVTVVYMRVGVDMVSYKISINILVKYP